MTYDHELKLIKQEIILDEHGNPATDAYGNQFISETETIVLCGFKSIGQSEFYNAAVAGLRPELTFLIHGYEYEGQEAIEFEGKRYRVIRTYSPSFEEVELICEEVAADG